MTRPHARIVARLREAGVRQPVIGFPRGCGALVEAYAEGAGVDAVALDVQAPLSLGRRLQQRLPIQGALDPLLLKVGGEAMERRARQMLDAWTKGPYVFNLGHGVTPDVPPEHVAQLVELVTTYGAQA